jgi:ribosome modulation factor
MKKYIIAIIFSILCFGGLAEARSYSAGPIWNDQDARTKCPAVCISHEAQWNGQWRTVEWAKNSTCDCVRGAVYYPGHRENRHVRVIVKRCQTRPISPGPIWSDVDAGNRCPQVCADNRSRWTGQWRTVIPGQRSVCQCRRCWNE